MSRATVSLFAALTALLSGQTYVEIDEPREPRVIDERARDRHRQERVERGQRRHERWQWSGRCA